MDGLGPVNIVLGAGAGTVVVLLVLLLKNATFDRRSSEQRLLDELERTEQRCKEEVAELRVELVYLRNEVERWRDLYYKERNGRAT